MGEISHEESLQTFIHPGKPLHSAKVTLNIRSYMPTSPFNSDRDVPNHNGHQNDLQAHGMSRSDIKAFTKFVPPIEQEMNEPNFRSTTCFEAKRDERGLRSKSGVPIVIDNRNRYLIYPEKNQGKTSTNNMKTRQTITGATFKRSMVPQSPHQQKTQPSKMKKEHQPFPTAKHDIEWNDQFNKRNPSEHVDTARRPGRHLQNSATHSALGGVNWEPVKYPRHDQFFDNTSLPEHKFASDRPERHLRNSANHLEQTMPHVKFSLNRQFHNKTISYPNSTEGYPYTSQRQTVSTRIRHQQYYSS